MQPPPHGVDRAMRDALGAALATRAVVFTSGLAATFLATPAGASVWTAVAELPNHWDASWYVGIAAGGYRWEPDQSNPRIAFFPGWPLLMGAVGRLLGLPDEAGPWLWLGVVLSLACFVGALFYLHRLADLVGGPGTGRRAVWIAGCYPFSLFYGQVYSEAFFLLSAVSSYYYAVRGRYWASAACGAIAGCVRVTGFLMVLPISALAWTQGGHGKQGSAWTPRLLACAAPIAGIVLYSIFTKTTTGDWFAWATGQQHFGRTLAWPFDPFVEMLAFVRANGLGALVMTRSHDLANLSAAVFALLAVMPVARHVGQGNAAFVLAGIIVPLSLGGLMSIGRFSAVLFPIFLYLGLRVRHPATVCVAFLALQAVLAAMFFTDRPIF